VVALLDFPVIDRVQMHIKTPKAMQMLEHFVGGTTEWLAVMHGVMERQ
jgi:hypothetical protein